MCPPLHEVCGAMTRSTGQGARRIGRRGVLAAVLGALAPHCCAGQVVDGIEQRAGEEQAASASASLHGWAARGRVDKVTRLLKLRANPAAEDGGYSTPVHAAARGGHMEVLALLLGIDGSASDTDVIEARPVVAADDVQGLRPLHWAALHGHAAAAGFLLRARAAADGPADRLGQQPLHLAARTGAASVVQLLLSHGAPVDHVDVEGCTPLLWAAYGGHAPATASLLGHHAAVDARDETGQTPLHWAARGHAAVVELLLLHGALPDARDAEGRTPIFWAEHEQRADILALLGAPKELGAWAAGRRRVSKPWVQDVVL